MKTALPVGLFWLLAIAAFTQSNTLSPNIYQLTVTSSSGCPANSNGKIFFSTQYDKILYCTGLNTAMFAESPWNGTTSAYYLGGVVGIAQGQPAYQLDVNSSARFSNSLFINSKLGIGTTTPSEKLEIVNKSITINSTADSKTWQFIYYDAADRIELQEIGNAGPLYINNGGNIGIGNIPSATERLIVHGDVGFTGSLTVGGYGAVANTTAAQLKLYTMTFTTNNSFFIPQKGCNTYGFVFPSGSFSLAPAVAIAHNGTGNNTADQQLSITVEAVTSTGGTVRFCNPKATSTTLPNYTFGLIVIGQ